MDGNLKFQDRKFRNKRYLLLALASGLVLAVAAVAGATPSGFGHEAAKLARESNRLAHESVSSVLRLAKGADKRSKKALKVARAPVTSARIADKTITSSDLAIDAVGSAEIAADAVGSPEIAASAVTSAKILNGTIETADLGDNVVTAAKLADSSVLSAKLGPDSVTSSKILDATIAIGDIAQSVWSASANQAGTLVARPAASASNAGFLYLATDVDGGTLYRSDGSSWSAAAPGVAGAAVPDGSITNAKLAPNAVTTDKVALDTLTAADLATDSVDSAEIAANAVTSSKLADSAVVGGTGGDVQDDSLTAADLAADSVTSSELANGAVVGGTGGDVSDDSLTAADIAPNAVGASELNKSATLIPQDITFVDGADASAVTWTNQPAAVTDFMGTSAAGLLAYDLSNASQARLQVNVVTAGASTPAKIRAQYTPDFVNWYYLDGGTGPSVNINTTGIQLTSWVDLASGAKASVLLRLVGLDGDGAADPAFGMVHLQVK